jgi:hypothetical protein
MSLKKKVFIQCHRMAVENRHSRYGGRRSSSLFAKVLGKSERNGGSSKEMNWILEYVIKSI